MTLLMASRTRNSVEQVEVLMAGMKQQGCRFNPRLQGKCPIADKWDY